MARFAPRGRDSPVDVVDEHLGAEHEGEPEEHEQHLRPEVDHGEHDRELGRLGDADEVQRDEHDDHGRADDDVPRVRPQRLAEDRREVVRDEERRRGDRDHVDEHLRPRRAEADQLVEPVAREARRATGLGEPHGALGVGRRGGGEHDAGDQEDERRQPEGEDGGEPERVVDRRADVAVGGGEERGRPEHALHPHLAPPSASGHRRSLETEPVGVQRHFRAEAGRPGSARSRERAIRGSRRSRG